LLKNRTKRDKYNNKEERVSYYLLNIRERYFPTGCLIIMSEKINSNITSLSVLPPSAQEIFQILSVEHRLKLFEINARTHYNRRTIQTALNLLKKSGLIFQMPDLLDMRRKIYCIKKKSN